MFRFDITSTAVTGERRKEFEKCREAASKYRDLEIGVQIHNSASEDEIQEVLSLGVPLSLHAPVSTAKWAFNLASDDETVLESSWTTLDKCAAFMRGNGIVKAVFHAFLMSDAVVRNFDKSISYDQSFGRLFRPELSMDGTSRFNRDFTGEEEFLRRRELLRANLAEVSRRYPDLEFFIENDFPTYGSGNMLASDANSLEHVLCFDVGHCWISSYFLGRDFFEETERFFAGGKVGMMHIHASPYTSAVPKTEWNDGHRSFDTPNEMDMPRVISIAKNAGLKYFVLEITGCKAPDIEYLAEKLF